jgi:putative transposase
MPFDRDKHHRHSTRLLGYDYSQRGIYFVTICTARRQQFLSEIGNGESRLTIVGEIVQEAWSTLPKRFPFIELDAFVVMPNHVHGVMAIVGAGLAPPAKREGSKEGEASLAPTTRASRVTLGQIVGAFKSLSAIEVNRRLHRPGEAVWQRGFYEHIVRGEGELQKVQRYIWENPQRWGFDPENPRAIDKDAEIPLLGRDLARPRSVKEGGWAAFHLPWRVAQT